MAEKNKSTLDILNEIRELRNDELRNQKDNRVIYTTAVALEKGETGRQIYRIMEEFSIGENQSLVREFFYIYTDKPELIAVIDPEKYDGILQVEGLESRTEEEKAELNRLIKDIDEARSKEKEKIKNQAIKLGISEKEVEGLSEIDIDKKVFAKINEINNQNNSKSRNSITQENGETSFTLTEQNARRLGIVGMNTIPLNQKVGIHGQSLKEELGLEGKPEYADTDKIEVIPAYKLATLGINVPDTPFIPIARHGDGSVEAFPKSVCKVYKGENNKVTKIDGQKDKAITQESSTIIEFAGKNATLAIDQVSPYGMVEASLAYNTRENDGRIALNLQDKYDGTDRTDEVARNIVDQHHGKEHNSEVIKEAQNHPNKEVVSREDVDGDENSKSHIHYDESAVGINLVIARAIEKISEECKVTIEHAEQRLNEKLRDENMLDGELNDEIIENATQEVIDDIVEESMPARMSKKEN